MSLDSSDTGRFWRLIADEHLPYHRCGACAHVDYPPLSSCRRCGERIDMWPVSGGGGTVRTWTLVERTGDPAFGAILPYAVAIVEMDEGFLMLAGIDPPDQVDIGRRVRITFHRSPATGQLVPHFVVAP